MENTTVQGIYDVLEKQLIKLNAEIKVDSVIYREESDEWKESKEGAECKNFIDGLLIAKTDLEAIIDNLGALLI